MKPNIGLRSPIQTCFSLRRNTTNNKSVGGIIKTNWIKSCERDKSIWFRFYYHVVAHYVVRDQHTVSKRLDVFGLHKYTKPRCFCSIQKAFIHFELLRCSSAPSIFAVWSLHKITVHPVWFLLNFFLPASCMCGKRQIKWNKLEPLWRLLSTLSHHRR